ncbi:MAG: RNA polymerase factor sigma-54, partial [Colwelliaceae bacterium]|nr:RNA polymerase factor sigma-54 [Colwelliaceae bacterium]
MRPSLQLKIGQQLTMTPQLQQAIKLLQLSTLDLQQEIQEALESNPLLEVDESSSSTDENQKSIEEEYSATAQAEQPSSDGSEDAAPTIDEVSTTEAMETNDIPEELSVDSTWDDSFSAGVSSSGIGTAGGDDYVYQGETTESIRDHLRWQM